MREERGTCPRCGSPISWIERHARGGRAYLVAAHYLGVEGGKKRVRKCYLGPQNPYEYVTRLHEREGLVLRGLTDADRVLAYLDALASYVSTPGFKIEPAAALELAGRLERIARRLRGYAEKHARGEKA